MRAVTAVWRFLQTLLGGTWRMLRGIYRRIVALLAGLVDPPRAALKRFFAAVRDRANQLVEILLTGWARVFQKAPNSPKDRRPTPGKSILVLAGSVISVSFWYLVPWTRWFELSPRELEFAIYGTAVGSALILRALMRTAPPSGIGRFLITGSKRVGLITFERLATAALLVAVLATWSDPALRPVSLLGFLSFLVLLFSPYEPRALVDDLPAIPDLDTEDIDAGFANHRFRWQLTWGSTCDEFAISVDVDTQRFAQMQTINPVVPSVPEDPDFTPWVVSGSTPEVDRVAKSIRDISNDLGYTRFQEAAAALGFAQSMTYSLDEDTTAHAEYWRYPIETIHDETGDCEDTTILAGSVLRRLGHGVLPLILPGHAALGVAAPPTTEGTFVVHDGRRYYYCETTAEGFKIGEIPPTVDPDTIKVSPLREPSV